MALSFFPVPLKLGVEDEDVEEDVVEEEGAGSLVVRLSCGAGMGGEGDQSGGPRQCAIRGWASGEREGETDKRLLQAPHLPC